MLDSNEKVQAQVDTQTSGVTLEANNESSELEKKELNKRALLEQEILKHPLFLNMQKATRNAHMNIMVEAIVDRYFDLTSEHNILQNQEFYKVNMDTIQMALHQTAYLISVEENGIVLEENGELDQKASLHQQEVAAYSEALKMELRDEERKDIYEKLIIGMDEKDKRLAEDYLNSFSFLEFSQSHELLLNALLQNESCPLSQEEWKQVSKKVVENTELNESQEQLEDELFIENEKDFITISNALKYTSMLNSKVKDFSRMGTFINEIKANDEKNRFIDEETGEFSAAKVEEFGLRYYANFTKRNSFKELKDFCERNEDFDSMDAKSQKTILTAIYSLYKMPSCHERDAAIVAMGRISPNSIDKRGIINEEKFLNLYNATEKGTKTFEEMETAITKKNYANLLSFARGMREQIRAGEFPTIDIPDGATLEQSREMKREFRKKMKEKNKPKFHKDTHEKLENEIDRLIRDNNLQGDRNDLVVAAYKILCHGNNPKNKACSEYLKEHIEGLASVYGKYIDDGKLVKRRNLDVNEEEVEKIVKGVLEFKKNEDKIQDKKFSFAKIKANLSNVREFIQDGIQYAGNQFKNLFKKSTLALPEGNEQEIMTEALFGTAEKDEDEASKEEIFIMTEEIAEVEADRKLKDDLEKSAQKEMEKEAKKLVKEVLKSEKEAQEVTKDQNGDTASATAHIEANDNDIFKRGITEETLRNLDNESRKMKDNLERAKNTQVQQEKQQKVTPGGER